MTSVGPSLHLGMLASSTIMPAQVPATTSVNWDHDPLPNGVGARTNFKRHKVLPHPENGRLYDHPRRTQQLPRISTKSINSALPESQSSSPRTLNHHSRRLGSGPELPPTPPSHSRASPGDHAPLASSPTLPNESRHEPVDKRIPATPPDQRSPPTPDVTPPQGVPQSKTLRSSGTQRIFSKAASADSRTESFKTAREEPASSGEEDGQSTIRPFPPSASTSQTTVRKMRLGDGEDCLPPHVLDLALEQLETNAVMESEHTPRTKAEFQQFDGSWNSLGMQSDGVEPSPRSEKRRLSQRQRAGASEDWVDPENVQKMRMTSIGLASGSPRANYPKYGLNATKLQDRQGLGGPSLICSPPSHIRPSTAPSAGAQVLRGDRVTALLQPPQRTRTLRHVRKQRALRDAEDDAAIVLTQDHTPRNQRHAKADQEGIVLPSPERRRHDSYSSLTSNASMNTNRLRRDVLRQGAIPVVIVPARMSSTKPKPSREQSLRSTSSRHSRRTASVGSAPLDSGLASGLASPNQQPVEKLRRYSEADPSDIRTIDYPPAVPRRSSSLSAPTSRNHSRASSLTGDGSLTRNALQQHLGQVSSTSRAIAPESPTTDVTGRVSRTSSLPREAAMRPDPKFHDITTLQALGCSDDLVSIERHFSIEQPDDTMSSRKYSSRNTPFSAASIDTNWTAPEIAEAKAVQLYPHQNSSVLVVNHSTKPSEASDIAPPSGSIMVVKEVAIEIDPESPQKEAPVTPPQPQHLSDVDSPLRNPRAPPEPPSRPPAFNFIPATPSGATPLPAKKAYMGNFYEVTKEKPFRKPSILKRALSHRRKSVEYPPNASRTSGFLRRTLSLTRSVHRESMSPSLGAYTDTRPSYPTEDDLPAEGDKLHPFWRPQWTHDDDDENDGLGGKGGVYRYPPIDNRPRHLRRSLSARIKHTFAILPTRDQYDDFLVDDTHGPERLTVKRTSSGNLHVVPRRDSRMSQEGRTLGDGLTTAAVRKDPPKDDGRYRRRYQDGATQPRRRSSLSARVEELQNLPRLFSERKREKRTQELRQMISGPREVRDGVGDMLRFDYGTKHGEVSRAV